MKTCILTIGTRGDVQPYIALGLGLKAAGHDVTIATLEDFKSLVHNHGLQHDSLRGDYLKAAKGRDGSSASKGRGNPLTLIRQYTEMARDTLRDEWESARDADLFIYSRAAIGADHIAEKLGVPALAAFPTPLYSPTREFPSPFFPFRELGPLNKGSHRLFTRMGPALYRRPINEWRRDVLGMPPARGEEWLNGRPVTTLYAYSEAVVPRPDDWDESSVVTGYWFLDAPAGWQPDPALVSFIENGPPPVYVGFGSMSMFGAAATTDAILEAITLAGQRAVLTNGESMPAADPLPGEVFVAGAVPHDWLFPRMAAVVHHGGAGTTGAALRAGKPTVICPFVGDQAFWGRRVAALGVGPSPVPFRKLTAGLLAGAIQRAVTDVEMQRQAASLGETIRAEDGIGRAVAVIANQLSTG